MIKSVKRLSAAILSAVMMLTAVATPLGDNLPAVRESTSLTASAASNPFGKWQTINGVTTIRCTYYAWQQAYDNTGVALPMLGNGCQWYDNAKNAGYSVGTTAKARSIAVWGSCTNNSYGHVAYVVSVNGGKMTVNEGGRSDATSTNGIVNGFSCGSTIGSKRYSGSPLIGFIYLDSTPSTDNVKLLNTSSHYTDEVYDDNAIVHGEVNKPTSYPVTRIGIQVRKDGDSFSNGWSRFDNTQKTYTNSSWMSPWFNIKTELGVTLVHCTRYYYKFYAVVNGKEYWSSENTFVTTGSHSYGSWYTKTSATCTSGGTEERKCSCGATESRSTSALGHNYGSTYFEADHPHKYAHLCQRCGYKEFTGGNLDYYYLCATCTHLTRPEVTKITGDLVDNSEITIEWTASESDKLANYWLDVFDPDGQNVVDVSTGKINSYTFTPVKTGTYTIKTYAAPIGNKDGNGSVGAETTIEIGCNHNYITEIVNPTYDNEGYTLHTCTKCGYSYKDNYTPALKPTELTGVKVKTQGMNSLTLAWDKNANAKGYIIEQYKGGKWTQIAKTSSNTAVTYTVNRLAADTTYTFRIKAYAISGESEIYSDYVRIAGKTRIANVASFKGSAVSASAVKLDWSKNDKATGYVIEQYKGGKWTALATTKNNTTLTFTVKGLADDTAYSFRIKSYRTVNGVTDFSEYTSVKAKTLLGNVKTFTAAATGTTAIKLDWSKNNKATAYVIEQYRGGKWTVLATTKNNTTLTFTVKGLAEGTAYSFRLKSLKTANGVTEESVYTSIKAATAVSGVKDAKVTSVTGSWITLEWAKNDKATGYSIEQYKGGKWTVIATTKNNTTLKFTVKGLKNDTTYSFRIRAYKTAGASNVYSDYVRIAGKTRIPNVAKFTGSAVSASAVKLSWSKNDKATGYVIEQYKGGKWTALATTKNNTTLTFTVKGLAKGTTYSFRIKSFRKTGGTTEFSEYASVKAATDK